MRSFVIIVLITEKKKMEVALKFDERVLTAEKLYKEKQ